ncbi:hypothetical protein [Nakamurella flava]|nr:hypothetical protein [Nakamurella flava]
MTMLLELADTTETTADTLAFTRSAGLDADRCTDASCVYCCGPETD